MLSFTTALRQRCWLSSWGQSQLSERELCILYRATKAATSGLGGGGIARYLPSTPFPHRFDPRRNHLCSQRLRFDILYCTNKERYVLALTYCVCCPAGVGLPLQPSCCLTVHLVRGSLTLPLAQLVPDLSLAQLLSDCPLFFGPTGATVSLANTRVTISTSWCQTAVFLAQLVPNSPFGPAGHRLSLKFSWSHCPFSPAGVVRPFSPVGATDPLARLVPDCPLSPAVSRDCPFCRDRIRLSPQPSWCQTVLQPNWCQSVSFAQLVQDCPLSPAGAHLLVPELEEKLVLSHRIFGQQVQHKAHRVGCLFDPCTPCNDDVLK